MRSRRDLRFCSAIWAFKRHGRLDLVRCTACSATIRRAAFQDELAASILDRIGRRGLTRWRCRPRTSQLFWFRCAALPIMRRHTQTRRRFLRRKRSTRPGSRGAGIHRTSRRNAYRRFVADVLFRLSLRADGGAPRHPDRSRTRADDLLAARPLCIPASNRSAQSLLSQASRLDGQCQNRVQPVPIFNA